MISVWILFFDFLGWSLKQYGGLMVPVHNKEFINTYPQINVFLFHATNSKNIKIKFTNENFYKICILFWLYECAIHLFLKTVGKVAVTKKFVYANIAPQKPQPLGFPGCCACVKHVAYESFATTS